MFQRAAATPHPEIPQRELSPLSITPVELEADPESHKPEPGMLSTHGRNGSLRNDSALVKPSMTWIHHDQLYTPSWACY